MAYVISTKKWCVKVLVMLIIVLFATISSISGNDLNQFHPLANIIAEANKEVVSCIPPGGSCDHDSECCPGNTCVLYWPLTYTACTWCPGPGDTCGAFDPCCPGYSCSGFFSGSCS